MVSTGLIVSIIIIVMAIAIVSRGMRIVPQQHEWVVERLGRYRGTLSSGLNIIIPLMDTVSYKFDLREMPIDIQQQICITKDNTQVSIDGILYVQITDAKKAAYGTTDPFSSVEQLAQTILRSDVGKKNLDEVLSERAELNQSIVSELDKAATNWGIKVLRYEIRDCSPPPEIIKAMEQQITAERNKRALIAKSEGEKQQAINVSEGDRQQAINRAEGEKQSNVLRAEGNAEAILKVADATAKSLKMIGAVLDEDAGSKDAMMLQVAQAWIDKWGSLAKESTTLVVPGDMGDASKFVATAMRIMDTANSKSSA